MQFRDYYQILGLDRSASADDIKKAYRKLARKYHPDVSKEADAGERMAEINEAHTVLSDPEKRAAYDTVGGQAWAQGARSGEDVRPPPGWNAGFEFSDGGAEAFRGGAGGGADFSEFFEELFGRQARARSHRGGPVRGSDHHARIELELADAYSGGERTVTLRGMRMDEHGHMVAEDRVLQVRIPQGVRDGQLIRLSGQGTPGVAGGAAGDLFLEVHLRDDARWRVDGVDVHQRLQLAPWEAALGGRIKLHTPNGSEVEVNVPAGSGSGRKLRLKGRGIPAPAGAGDLYLELQLTAPAASTDAQRAAWEALARTYPGFDARA